MNKENKNSRIDEPYCPNCSEPDELQTQNSNFNLNEVDGHEINPAVPSNQGYMATETIQEKTTESKTPEPLPDEIEPVLQDSSYNASEVDGHELNPAVPANQGFTYAEDNIISEKILEEEKNKASLTKQPAFWIAFFIAFIIVIMVIVMFSN